MNNQNKSIVKQAYHHPQIVRVILDNEISLALESNPMEGPNEVNNYNSPDYFNCNPFEKDMV